MARKGKCKNCSKEISKEERFVIDTKGYCEECHNEVIEEKGNYKLLISTICKYFSIDKPSGLIIKQIKQYKEEFGYNNGGICYTLWYIKEIKGKKFELKYGIALVKYHYEEAKRYFEQQQKIADSVNTQHEVKIREVKLNLNKLYKREKSNLTIDINELMGGE